MLILSLALVLLGSNFLTSCKSEDEYQVSMKDQLVADQSFTDAAIASVDFFVTAQANQWQENASQIADLMRKAQAEGLTASDEAALEELLGMSREAYIRTLTNFGTAWNDLLVKYPALQDMDASERQALFADAVSQNEELALYLADLQEVLRACPLQDICNIVVDLAVAIGGPILCDYIANAVPIIGPLLCNIALDLATDLLRGICSALPC